MLGSLRLIGRYGGDMGEMWGRYEGEHVTRQLEVLAYISPISPPYLRYISNVARQLEVLAHGPVAPVVAAHGVGRGEHRRACGEGAHDARLSDGKG